MRDYRAGNGGKTRRVPSIRRLLCGVPVSRMRVPTLLRLPLKQCPGPHAEAPMGRGLGPATLPTPWLLGAWLRNQAVIRSAIWRVPRPQCQWCGVRVVTRGRVPTISRSLQAGTGGKTRPSPNTPQRNARKALLGLVTWMREMSRRSNTPLRNARLPHGSPVTQM